MRPLTERQELVLRTMRELGRERTYMTAEDIGAAANLPPVRRRGRGAVKGSWSGRIAPGLQVASTLQSLEKRGLVVSADSGRSRRVAVYRLADR